MEASETHLSSGQVGGGQFSPHWDAAREAPESLRAARLANSTGKPGIVVKDGLVASRRHRTASMLGGLAMLCLKGVYIPWGRQSPMSGT